MTPTSTAAAAAPQAVKCLLVDDLPENLLALSALLRDDGVELLQARSGAEALELLLQHEVALALIDVQMPEMDGFELAELMRGSARTQAVPIIFVTAGVHDQLRMFRGYDSGAVDFLYKPIEPRILRNKAGVFFELYRQRQQLAQQLQERTEALRLNEMFMAVLGHDLRNPLHAILLSGELLKRQAETESQRKTAERVLSSGKRMSRMIEDLLDLARVRNGGGLVLRPEPIDLARLAQRMAEEAVGNSGVPPLRIEAFGDVRGEWDSERLAQVLTNLIGNALRHGSGGEIEICVDGTASTAVELRISNAGEIAAELLPHLFEPFRGRERRGSRSEGLGLGLYIAKQIVQAHQGLIDAQSQQGRVSLRVRLPRSPRSP